VVTGAAVVPAVLFRAAELHVEADGASSAASVRVEGLRVEVGRQTLEEVAEEADAHAAGTPPAPPEAWARVLGGSQADGLGLGVRARVRLEAAAAVDASGVRRYTRTEVRFDVDAVCAQASPRPVVLLRRLVESFAAAAAQPPPPPPPPPPRHSTQLGWLPASASWGCSLAAMFAAEGATSLPQLLPWLMREKTPASLFDSNHRLVQEETEPHEPHTAFPERGETGENEEMGETEMEAAASVDLAASVSELFFDCADAAPPGSNASSLYGSAMFHSALSSRLDASVASVHDARGPVRDAGGDGRQGEGGELWAWTSSVLDSMLDSMAPAPTPFHSPPASPARCAPTAEAAVDLPTAPAPMRYDVAGRAARVLLTMPLGDVHDGTPCVRLEVGGVAVTAETGAAHGAGLVAVEAAVLELRHHHGQEEPGAVQQHLARARASLPAWPRAAGRAEDAPPLLRVFPGAAGAPAAPAVALSVRFAAAGAAAHTVVVSARVAAAAAWLDVRAAQRVVAAAAALAAELPPAHPAPRVHAQRDVPPPPLPASSSHRVEVTFGDLRVVACLPPSAAASPAPASASASAAEPTVVVLDVAATTRGEERDGATPSFAMDDDGVGSRCVQAEAAGLRVHVMGALLAHQPHSAGGGGGGAAAAAAGSGTAHCLLNCPPPGGWGDARPSPPRSASSSAVRSLTVCWRATHTDPRSGGGGWLDVQRRVQSLRAPERFDAEGWTSVGLGSPTGGSGDDDEVADADETDESLPPLCAAALQQRLLSTAASTLQVSLPPVRLSLGRHLHGMLAAAVAEAAGQVQVGAAAGAPPPPLLRVVWVTCDEVWCELAPPPRPPPTAPRQAATEALQLLRLHVQGASVLHATGLDSSAVSTASYTRVAVRGAGACQPLPRCMLTLPRCM
jgi:hypothetical protein